MIVSIKNNTQVRLEKLSMTAVSDLSGYLRNLGAETVKRFAPHAFDEHSIRSFYENIQPTIGYFARDIDNAEIIGYAVIRIGYLDHDLPRLSAYGRTYNKNTDCTFAPSVADDWQGKGVGNALIDFILQI